MAAVGGSLRHRLLPERDGVGDRDGPAGVCGLGRETFMSTEPSGVSDMLATVKSREVQRALLAEMAGDRAAATRHFLAAAHLEVVLAEDYAAAGAADLVLRAGLSA